MRVRTVVVSNYPMFKAGLRNALGPGFEVLSYFNRIKDMLAADIDCDLIIVDDAAAKESEALKLKELGIAVLRLSLDNNTGYLCLYGVAKEEAFGKQIQELSQRIPIVEKPVNICFR